MASMGKTFSFRTCMERLRRRARWDEGMAGGRSRVRKWVRSEGIEACRRANQWAERRVRREPLDGIPCGLFSWKFYWNYEDTHILHDYIVCRDTIRSHEE